MTISSPKGNMLSSVRGSEEKPGTHGFVLRAFRTLPFLQPASVIGFYFGSSPIAFQTRIMLLELFKTCTLMPQPRLL